MKLQTILISALAASLAQAQKPATYSPGNDLSYAISIPQTTAQSGNGDIYFQMTGPTANSWIAMGFGNSMTGSSIYVMYADGTGNVTVSPRLGVGNVMPRENPAAKVEMLEGSGITGGMMTANVRCTGCTTWTGDHSIDLTSNSQPMIWAQRMGAALDTTNDQATLIQHQNNGQNFNFDLTAAAGGMAGINPFSSAPATAPAGAGSGSSSSGSSDGGMDSSMVLKAHGTIMGLTVVLLLPLGALIMRVIPIKWWMHGAIQTFFLILFTVGYGLGYSWAQTIGTLFKGDDMKHTILGTVILAFFWLQPILGYAHHLMYKKQGKRTVVSHTHIWWGRIVFILAIANGGYGLYLADNTTGGKIAYGVIAGVVGLTYIGAAVFGEMRQKKKGVVAGETGEMAKYR